MDHRLEDLNGWYRELIAEAFFEIMECECPTGYELLNPAQWNFIWNYADVTENTPNEIQNHTFPTNLYVEG